MVAERKDISRPTGVRPSRNGKRAPVQIDRRFAIGRRIDLLATVFGERVRLDEVDPDPVLLAAVDCSALARTRNLFSALTTNSKGVEQKRRKCRRRVMTPIRKYTTILAIGGLEKSGRRE